MQFNVSFQTGSLAFDGADCKANFHHFSVPTEANKPNHHSAAETPPVSNLNSHLGSTLYSENLTVLCTLLHKHLSTFHLSLVLLIDPFFRVLEGSRFSNATQGDVSPRICWRSTNFNARR